MSLADREALRQTIGEQKKLSVRITALEGALINEPAKALAVPLLEKDVDDLHTAVVQKRLVHLNG